MEKHDNNILNKKISLLIRQLRNEKGITQESLANLSGLDRTYISGIERNKRNISMATLSKIISIISKNSGDFFKQLGESLLVSPTKNLYLLNKKADLEVLRSQHIKLDNIEKALNHFDEIIQKITDFEVDIFALLGMR